MFVAESDFLDDDDNTFAFLYNYIHHSYVFYVRLCYWERCLYI